MTRLPRLTGKEMVHFLKSRGFELLRVRGSHYFVQGYGKRTTIPVHGNRDLKTGTLRSILRDVDLNPAEFSTMWEGRYRHPPRP